MAIVKTDTRPNVVQNITVRSNNQLATFVEAAVEACHMCTSLELSSLIVVNSHVNVQSNTSLRGGGEIG